MVAPSLDEYLLRRRGPKHLPLTVVVPITVVYSVILTAGVIGNLAVCLVIAKNSAMHTATNYYLFSLAVSDLTLLILGPYPMTFIYLSTERYPEFFCPTLLFPKTPPFNLDISFFTCYMFYSCITVHEADVSSISEEGLRGRY
ncbi:hypothetical protein AAG570_013011 [Ranatra chinensis]|uniref:G-protein coupled receptors family 1 profile domain-containing protein n=1 Tax=Ranatra chinensis TaxID=642074 RepID=A0ABD0YFJ0_9HEMI